MRMLGIWYGVALGLMLMSVVGGGMLLAGSRADPAALAFLFGTCVGCCWFADGVALGLRAWRGDRLTERERQARAEQTEQINYERYLRNLERERRLEGTDKPAEKGDAYAADWRVAAHRFLAWGDRYGFGIHKLAAKDEPGRCVSWDDWKLMRVFLIDAGILVGSEQYTRWAHDWNWQRWQAEGRTLPLPHRSDPAPEVSIPVNSQHQHPPQRATEPVGG